MPPVERRTSSIVSLHNFSHSQSGPWRSQCATLRRKAAPTNTTMFTARSQFARQPVVINSPKQPQQLSPSTASPTGKFRWRIRHAAKPVSVPEPKRQRDHSSGTSSAQTRNPDKVAGPNVCVRGTSVASRPRAMRIRPIRGALLRGSKAYQRSPR